MPHLLRPCGARIFYEVRGSGRVPVFCLAPGGMRSSIAMWDAMPWNPWKELSGDHFKLIAMDQRNSTIRSRPNSGLANLGIGWQTYADDQLALLDHLGVEKCLTIGSCIGPSYQLRLMQHAPSRFIAAVMMQPIGLCHSSTEKQGWMGTNKVQTRSWFRVWEDEMLAASHATPEELEKLNFNMFELDGGAAGFAFSVSPDEIRNIKAELLVLAGVDAFHPAEAARKIASLAPNAELVEGWRDGQEQVLDAAEKMDTFLRKHGAKL